MNALYAAKFPSEQPARVTYAVLGLPLSARMEIDCIAVCT